MSFPGSPVDGQFYNNYYWDNTSALWRAAANQLVPAPLTSNTTLDATSPLNYQLNPISGAFAVTLPDPSTVTDRTYAFSNNHYGSGLINYADCESTSKPIITGETTPLVSNARFERSNGTTDPAHGGTYSYKVIKDIAPGAAGYTSVLDGAATNDAHGLTLGQTYTLSFWANVPSTGGPLNTETRVLFSIYDGAWSSSQVYYSGDYDTWQRIESSIVIPASGTPGVRALFYVDSAAADEEYYFIDDIQLYRNYDATIKGPIENVTSIKLTSEGDIAVVKSDGEKYLLVDYCDHGQNTNGDWRREADGTMEQWDDECDLTGITTAAGHDDWSLPKSFADTDYTYGCLGEEADYTRIIIPWADSLKNVGACRFRGNGAVTADCSVWAKGRWR